MKLKKSLGGAGIGAVGAVQPFNGLRAPGLQREPPDAADLEEVSAGATASPPRPTPVGVGSVAGAGLVGGSGGSTDEAGGGAKGEQREGGTQIPSVAGFEASDIFNGYRSGMEFKQGSQGLGYYPTRTVRPRARPRGSGGEGEAGAGSAAQAETATGGGTSGQEPPSGSPKESPKDEAVPGPATWGVGEEKRSQQVGGVSTVIPATTSIGRNPSHSQVLLKS